MAYNLKLMEVIQAPGGGETELQRLNLGVYDGPWPCDIPGGYPYPEGHVPRNTGHLRWEVHAEQEKTQVDDGFTDWDDAEKSLKRIHIQNVVQVGVGLAGGDID